MHAPASATGPETAVRSMASTPPAGHRVLNETPRQIARCYWQPDADAERCSISSCNNTFSWTLGARRHHCRQCGRVVCETCSRGKRLLLPPLGEKGPVKKVRVCNACLRNSETYVFCHAETSTQGAATRMPALLPGGLSAAFAHDCCIEYALSEGGGAGAESSKRESVSGRLLQTANTNAACSFDDGRMQLADKLPLSTLSTAETPIHGAEAQGQEQGEDGASAAQAAGKQGVAAAARASVSAPADRAGLSPTPNLHSEYYHGLKTYEPAALALLLCQHAQSAD